ncbi:MAG: bifunctional 4-hydroxy-2-oxoglutarate aldolase/2-dehydro-3-deoxy-phosphogluconate aldolase [Pseudomonadota bacterium]|nr:bifunctional 4-hydroxy-2-oxoglutarate aldolase/2-dehydro-3-deoxy-phosphogluconate aldolase [Pseudomonadota bacterium]
MNIRDVMTAAPVIPVIVIEDIKEAVPMAQALVKGGLPVLEITLRTKAGLEAIRAVAAEVEGAIVGVGTITRPEEFRQSRDAGAVFGVTPGLTRELIAAARDTDLSLLPGVMTPSEVIAARLAGYTALKLFPAQQAGGMGMLKAMAGPFPDVVFCPTGGVSAETFRDFLALPNVLCVGGSWVVPKKAIQAGDWGTITRLAAEASGKPV